MWVCCDVGFGKTEVAIRAAFKAVCDGKQVAVLVPTTVLAFQHYKSFSERLGNFACTVDYLNRFRSAKEIKSVLQGLESGKTDIIIGTHRILSKDVKFKDLGLLIIDEEHKFGVSVKEKLKSMKVNLDTLTLTATPIPRTLQFSLMGARDLSVINTPPANRQPVNTEIISFSQERLRDIIMFELSRNGQVYFVHNKVQDIEAVAELIRKLVPMARVVVGHGQMKGEQLEGIMMDFIEGEFDVLVATTIVENGLDIPNANTIIIDQAQNYGLSDLHQLRGRVGRSNKKAYCYLIAPDECLLSEESAKRLRAIEEFSAIGSGFAIAMRDLDIRGAGNILGAEQSGFISEIGFDAYHKILNEAIRELKSNDFKELFVEEIKQDGYYVESCTIETDLEIFIPDTYVSDIVERLKLYKR
ncbi:MAG: helicase-related protein [Bacteroidales bacterium]|nr:helicase-related protein [Bacteroidales bacterium]